VNGSATSDPDRGHDRDEEQELAADDRVLVVADLEVAVGGVVRADLAAHEVDRGEDQRACPSRLLSLGSAATLSDPVAPAPQQSFSRWRARRTWLRTPARARERLERARAAGSLGGDDLGLLAWLELTLEGDEDSAERDARAALAQAGEARFAAAALAEALQRRGDADGAVEAIRSARERHPKIPWYALTLADALVAAGRVDEARPVLEEAAEHPELRRHALKRLSRLTLEQGDAAAARHWFAELVALAPDYLVYASDYDRLGTLELAAGEREAAHATWRCGARIYPRNARLRELLAEHFGEREALARPKIAPVSEGQVGAKRIPVRTPFITLRTRLAELIADATRDVLEPGDVIALAESATAASQGRIVPLELVGSGPLARVLCRFVGKIGPLHSPEGMQGAVLVAGRPRVVLGAIAGAVGKLIGRRGWFYRVAGPQTAMIDDVAAAMPPHDHHVVFGPRAPDETAAELAAALGAAVAIVDANHLTGAWVVGASSGVDRPWLTAALEDNPAGNEDEQTPVVLVRPT